MINGRHVAIQMANAFKSLYDRNIEIPSEQDSEIISSVLSGVFEYNTSDDVVQALKDGVLEDRGLFNEEEVDALLECLFKEQLKGAALDTIKFFLDSTK